MTLSALIRKRDTGNLATAIPAISATQPQGEAGTVARIATVEVAIAKEENAERPATVGAGNTATASQWRRAESPGDLRTCDQCANLIARRCQAAKRGEIVASRDYEPVRELPRRCEGYVPGAGDPDRRPACVRWPGLIQNQKAANDGEEAEKAGAVRVGV